MTVPAAARDGATPVAVRVREVTMNFGKGAPAVDRASFDLAQGRFLTILGPSGSGKTTLLRMIAGFQRPTSGEIALGGRPVGEDPPHRRSIGIVFQRLALFPHMTAAQNVAFPLEMRRFDPATIPGRVQEYLNLVRLDGLGGRRVQELSGGQQQRVAIARALVFAPELLLLDEPLAALDRKLREEMQLEFRRIQHELGVTTINVTHDQREALVVSDEIIVMDRGRIQQHDRPVATYRQPANSFVAGFLSVSSFVEGRAAPGGITVTGRMLPGLTEPGLATGAPARAVIRAEQIRIGQAGSPLADCDIAINGAVRDIIFEGERLLYVVACLLGGTSVEFQVHHHDPAMPDPFGEGAPVTIGWRAQDLRVFAAAPEQTRQTQQERGEIT